MQYYAHKMEDKMLKEILNLILSLFKKEREEMFTKEDVLILAKTIYGEARGEISQGKVAVGCVIMNRYYSKKWFAGSTLAGTCLKKMQFSCWNDNDPNKKILENITKDKLGDCYTIAKNLTDGVQQDITQGATHYHTLDCNPAWAKDKECLCVIGHHKFYKNID